ncbi:HIS7, partial [Symbiodinium sp. CCMP2456]
MTKLLNHVADEKMLENLTKWVKAFMEAVESEWARQWMAKDALGQHLSGPFESAGRFCKAVAFLFQIPVAGHPAMEDVAYFMDYTGPVVWRKSIKGILKNPEPDGPNHSEIKHKSRELLKRLYQDAVRTAATEGPAKQVLQTLQAALKSGASELRPNCCQPLGEVLNQMGELEKKLRKGGSQELQQAAIAFTKDLTEKVLEETAPSILGQDVDVLLQSLKVFSAAKKEFPTLRTQLTAWATAHNTAMASQEVELELKQFVAEAQKQEALTKVMFDAHKIKDLLGKISKPLQGTLREEMVKAFPYLLEQVLQKVVGGEPTSTALLASLAVMTKMATWTEHPHEALASLQVKGLKSHMLFMSLVADLEGLGRDTQSRLRKDSKFKMLREVSNHESQCKKIFEEIGQWEAANAESMTSLGDMTPDLIAPEDKIVLIDIVKRIQNRAPCERDTVYTDCVQQQSAEYSNLLRTANHSMQKVSRSFYAGGASCWKITLGENSDLTAVLARASSTLLQIPMETMKHEIQ